MKKEKILNLPLLMYKGKMQIKWNSKISGIYAWINEINGKIYIGQSNNFYKRIYDEMNGFKNNRHQNMFKLFNSIKKHGIDNFRVVRLLECPIECLNKLEPLLIEYYNSMKNGYNCNLGGNGNRGHIKTKNQIEKQRISLYNYWTKDRCIQQSEKMKQWFNSRSLDEQTKMKTGNSWWLNDEYRKKQLENTRKSLTPTRIEKQRSSLLNYYKNHTSKKAIKCIIISPKNNPVTICGVDAFCKQYNIGKDGITEVLKRRKKYHKGWHLPEAGVYIPPIEKVIGPGGLIYEFTSITKFCKEKNIDKGNLRKVMNGITRTCGGYKKYL